MMGYPENARNSGRASIPSSLSICSMRPWVVAPWLTPMIRPSRSAMRVKPLRFFTMRPT